MLFKHNTGLCHKPDLFPAICGSVRRVAHDSTPLLPLTLGRRTAGAARSRRRPSSLACTLLRTASCHTPTLSSRFP